MRDMEEEESQENTKRASETPRPPQEKYTSRDATPVCKNFESKSQILRELAEEEDEQTAKKASETPCPPQHTEPQMFITAATTTKESLKPLSFHIASDELHTLSQIEREMAEEEAQAASAEPNTIETPAEKISFKPVSYHFRSDDILSDAQIEFELAKDEAQAKKSNRTKRLHNS